MPDAESTPFGVLSVFPCRCREEDISRGRDILLGIAAATPPAQLYRAGQRQGGDLSVYGNSRVKGRGADRPFHRCRWLAVVIGGRRVGHGGLGELSLV